MKYVSFELELVGEIKDVYCEVIQGGFSEEIKQYDDVFWTIYGRTKVGDALVVEAILDIPVNLRPLAEETLKAFQRSLD